MDYLHPQMKHTELEWRRDKVVALYSEGRNQSTIAKILHLSRVTVHRDLHYKIQETRSKARIFLEERIPFENEICRVGLNKVLEKVWDIINDERTSERARLHALSLAKDCYAMRMNLLESKAEIEQTMQLIFKHQEELQEQVANSFASAHLTEPTDYRLSQCKF